MTTIQNHNIWTLESGAKKIQIKHMGITYRYGSLKIAIKVHTDGTQATYVPTIDVEGSSAPFVKVKLTITKEWRDLLLQIRNGKESVRVTSSGGVDMTCYLEETIDIPEPGGEVEISFLAASDRSN